MPEYISRIISRCRRLILFMMDSMLVCIAYRATWMLISGRTSIMDLYLSMMISSCFLFVACYSIVYYATGMYDSLWRYAEIIEFFRCAASSLIAVVAFGIISSIIYTERRIPYSVFGRSAAFASSLIPTPWLPQCPRRYRKYPSAAHHQCAQGPWQPPR